MGEYRREIHLCPFYLYDNVKGIGGLNIDMKFHITEDLKNDLY